jgi:signal transduction histidine kinase
VLGFGSFATVRLVRRELKIAQLQADFAATVSHEFRSPLTGIRQLGEMLLAGRAAHDEGKRRQSYQLICRFGLARLNRRPIGPVLEQIRFFVVRPQQREDPSLRAGGRARSSRSKSPGSASSL